MPIHHKLIYDILASKKKKKKKRFQSVVFVCGVGGAKYYKRQNGSGLCVPRATLLQSGECETYAVVVWFEVFSVLKKKKELICFIFLFYFTSLVPYIDFCAEI